MYCKFIIVIKSAKRNFLEFQIPSGTNNKLERVCNFTWDWKSHVFAKLFKTSVWPRFFCCKIPILLNKIGVRTSTTFTKNLQSILGQFLNEILTGRNIEHQKIQIFRVLRDQTFLYNIWTTTLLASSEGEHYVKRIIFSSNRQFLISTAWRCEGLPSFGAKIFPPSNTNHRPWDFGDAVDWTSYFCLGYGTPQSLEFL